jgi:hypothetical protein
MKKPLRIITLSLGILSIPSLTSCSSTSTSSAPPSAAPAENAFVLDKPQTAAHQAALHALATIGAVVQKDTLAYVQGRRPNKMGLVVGSGGETVKIWLTAQGSKTSVSVKTEKSFAGIAGQKNWDAQVIAAMQ